MAGNIVAAVAFIVLGIAMAANIGGFAASLATVYRRFPWWTRSRLVTYTAGVRLFGVLFVVVGAVFAFAAAHG